MVKQSFISENSYIKDQNVIYSQVRNLQSTVTEEVQISGNLRPISDYYPKKDSPQPENIKCKIIDGILV